jgi:hypothetical protein
MQKPTWPVQYCCVKFAASTDAAAIVCTFVASTEDADAALLEDEAETVTLVCDEEEFRSDEGALEDARTEATAEELVGGGGGEGDAADDDAIGGTTATEFASLLEDAIGSGISSTTGSFKITATS